MSLRSALSEINDRIKRTAPGYMLVLSLVIGLLGGYGAVGFRYLILVSQDAAWDTNHFDTGFVAGLDWWWVLVIPTIGGLLVGVIIRWFSPEARGHGVPEVMEAVARRNGAIRPRVVVAKAVASGICIGSGGSVGREGPMVQIGSAIGSSVGQFLKVGPRRMRTLVGCGAAAGIAATFNAPVAGALFAVEVILGDFAVPQFSPIVISSVAATVVSHHYIGNLPAFEIPAYRLSHPAELLAYAILGLLAGTVAWAFVRTLVFSEDRFEALPIPLALKPMLGGTLIGLLALAVPGVLGLGYDSINAALMHSPTVLFLVTLLGAKLLAVCITLGSGGSGGILAPSLFLGSMVGGLVGLVVHLLFPELPSAAGAYALVGMGAMVAATTHAPITAILIIFELTNDYRIMLPLMTSCIIATLLSMRLDKESIYTVKLTRRGINVRAGQDINLLRNIRVSEVLVEDDIATVPPSAGLDTLIARMTLSDDACFYVVDEERRLRGVLSMRELRPALNDADVLGHLIVAEDIADSAFPFVTIGDNLDTVLTRLDLGYRDELPVTNADGGQLLGVVRIADVLARYRQELTKREVAAGPGL